MEDKNYKLWDIVIKGLGSILTAASILIGISNFNIQHKEISELDFKREIWKKKLNTYSHTCESAGKLIINFKNPKVYKKTLDEFLSLYWGELYMISETSVLLSAANFKDYAEAYEPTLVSDDYLNTLKLKLVNFSQKCQADLKKTKIQLQEDEDSK